MTLRLLEDRLSKERHLTRIRQIALAAFLALAATAAIAADEEAPDRYVDCRLVEMPAGTHTNDSGYTALIVGLNGRVYIGTARYGGYSHLVEYDPVADRIRSVVDTQQLTREHRDGLNSQGKTHTKLIAAPDGKIWCGTKQGNEDFRLRPEYGEDPEGYPGGHLYYYDPKTETAATMGILVPQEGLMGGVMDVARNRLYFYTCPKTHLIYYDIADNRLVDKGDTGTVARYMAIDPEGRVYVPGPDTMARYDPQSDRLEEIPLALEGDAQYGEPPYCVALDPKRRILYGLPRFGQYVQAYDVDLTADGKMRMRYVARYLPEPMTCDIVHGGILDDAGRLYYTAREKDKEDILHLMCYDPERGDRRDLGILRSVDPPDTPIGYIQGFAWGPDGTLYLTKIGKPYSVVIIRSEVLQAALAASQ
jgi:hypothetical protein